jgi:hypothetical protein
MTAVAVALAGITGGCSSKVLVVVGPCPDGGVTSGAPGCSPGLLDELVGHWRLDDGAGSTMASDSSTRDNHGTLVNLNPATAWVAGRAAGALAVGAAGFVQVNPSRSIDSITDQVTIAGWVYLEGTIIDYGTAASRQLAETVHQHYHIALDPGGRPMAFVWTDGGDAVLMAPAATAAAPQTWVHLAATYDGGVVRLYVDGREMDSEALSGQFIPDTTPVILGGNGNDRPGVAPTELFPGRIDEIMLYRRALAAEEIVRLHAGRLFDPPAGSDAGARD